MKRYGADANRCFDTEPVIKSARAHENQVADTEIEEGLYYYSLYAVDEHEYCSSE